VPVYMEISRLHRTVTLVARGKITPDEIRGMAQQLAEANVRSFAKIVEVAGATTEFSYDQVVRVSEFLRGASTEKRGPVAFIVDPNRTGFPEAFAKQTVGEGPISLFTSLREARTWLERIQHHPEEAGKAAAAAGQTAWTDPKREGVMIRGARQRGVPIRSLRAA
jgi:hypothetical protein